MYSSENTEMSIRYREMQTDELLSIAPVPSYVEQKFQRSSI